MIEFAEGTTSNGLQIVLDCHWINRVMPRISFTQNLQRHVPCPDQKVEGETVQAALENVFRESPRLRSYILDDQGALHRHMAIMVNGSSIQDRTHLNHPVAANDEIYILQALSGG